MILIKETSRGVLLPVKAQPGARRNGVTGEHAGMLKVAVTQAPENGKANNAIVVVLSDTLDLKRSQIELVSGAASSLKKFLIIGIPLAELQQRIAHALEQTG